MSNKQKIICPECKTGMSFDSGTSEIECPVCLKKLKVESVFPASQLDPPVQSTPIPPPISPVVSPSLPPMSSKKNVTINFNKPLVSCLAGASAIFLLIILFLLIKLASGGRSEHSAEATSSALIKSDDKKDVKSVEILQSVPAVTSLEPEKKSPVPEVQSDVDNKEKNIVKEEKTESPPNHPDQKEDSDGSIAEKSPRKTESEWVPPSPVNTETKKPPPEFSDSILRKKIVEVSNYSDAELERGKSVNVQAVSSEVDKLLKQSVDQKYPDSDLEKIKKVAEDKFSTAELVPSEEKFPRAMLDITKTEAEGKYPLINVGDRISFESGSKKYEGIYQGYVGRDKISLSFKNISEQDVPQDILVRLTQNGAAKAKEGYINKKYFIPKTKYETLLKKNIDIAEKSRSKYINEYFFIPKLAFIKSERDKILLERFTYYGFRFNDWSCKWEPKDEFVENTSANLKDSLEGIADLQIDKDFSDSALAEDEKRLSTLENDYKIIKSRIKDFKEFLFTGYYIRTRDDNLYEVAERIRGDWDYYASNEHVYLISSRKFSYSNSSNLFSMKVLVYEIKDDSKRYSKTYDGLFDAEDYSTLEASLKEARDEVAKMKKNCEEINSKMGKIKKLFKKYDVTR